MEPFALTTLVARVLVALGVLQPAGRDPGPDPFAVMAEVKRIAPIPLWPGFDPRRVPVAIHDGERTLLFNHPAAPEGFGPVEGRADVHVFPGLHPAVRANTSVELGDRLTATYLLDLGDRRTTTEIAAAVIHETFHVFQRQRHPGWTANEVELFSYPVDDAGLLKLRRLEAEALRRALSADSAVSACWAKTALRLRRERFATLSERSAGYERVSELNEGLAQYVESLAAREATGPVMAKQEVTLSIDEFPPESVRERTYVVGEALALLLDRFDPDWKDTLEAEAVGSLDELLEFALERDGGASMTLAAGCEFSAEEREAALSRAWADVAELRGKRAELRRGYLAEPGWRVVVLASAKDPLFPQGFDPLNVEVLGGGEVLHTRWLKLGSSAGALEALDRRVLTEGTVDQPLFAGVRKVTVAGLLGEPVVWESESATVVSADGFSAEFRGAKVERAEQTLTLRL